MFLGGLSSSNTVPSGLIKYISYTLSLASSSKSENARLYSATNAKPSLNSLGRVATIKK